MQKIERTKKAYPRVERWSEALDVRSPLLCLETKRRQTHKKPWRIYAQTGWNTGKSWKKI